MHENDPIAAGPEAEPPTGLGGRVFEDRNNNGVFESADADTGIDGVVMELVDEATDLVVGQATTANNGRYAFPDVPAGTYSIVQVDQPDS